MRREREAHHHARPRAGPVLRHDPLALALVLLGPLSAVALVLLAREARACATGGACHAEAAALMLYLVIVCVGTLAIARAFKEDVEPVVFSTVPVAAFAVSTFSAHAFTPWAPAFLAPAYAVVFTPPFMTAIVTLAALSVASTSLDDARHMRRDGVMALASVAGGTAAAITLAFAIRALPRLADAVTPLGFSALVTALAFAALGFRALAPERKGATGA